MFTSENVQKLSNTKHDQKMKSLVVLFVRCTSYKFPSSARQHGEKFVHLQIFWPMTAQLGSNDCHAELLLREKNLEGRNFRHAIVHRNAGKKLIILEINMIINGVF